MASTFSGRYNNVTNSNIAMNAVNGNTSIGNDLNSYRGKSGVPSSGAVSFSDLRGMYNTTNETNGYFVPGQSSSNNTFEKYWTYSRYKSTSFGSGYYTSWYISGYVAGSESHIPYTSLGYHYNADTGGYNWGYMWTDRTASSTPRANLVIGAIFNKQVHIFIGDMKTTSTERAIGFGYIGLKYLNPTNNTATVGLSTVNPFVLLVGQRYDSAPNVDYQTAIFRTNTRSYLKATWITGGALFIGTLTTAPFNSGAALSAYSSNQQLTSSTALHINNTAGMGFSVHYGDNQPTAFKPLIQWYDVGLRNARSKSTFTNAVTDAGAVDGTTAVLPFNT